LAEIARLQEKLPRDGNQRSAGFMLERYLDNLTSYAETAIDTFSDGSDGSRPTSRLGSSGRDMVPQIRIESIESGDIIQPGPGPAFPAPPKEREHIRRVFDAEKSTEADRLARTVRATDTKPSGLHSPSKNMPGRTTAVDSSSSLFTRFKAKLNDKRHKEIPAQGYRAPVYPQPGSSSSIHFDPGGLKDVETSVR